MKKCAAIAAALALALPLCACSGFNPRVEELIRPPKLTEEQTAIEEALLGSAISGHITFKYPKSGDYRSAFVFHDIDGDGQEEALVFYAAPDLSDYARISLLDRQGDQWVAMKELAGADQDVEFVSFASVTRPGRADILVGWSSPDQEGKQLGVYTFRAGELEELYSGAYESYLVEDLGEDGLDDIFLLGRDNGDPTLSMVSWDGYSLSRMSRRTLSGRTSQFAGLTAGRLTTGDTQKGVFVDELLASGRLATEVFTIENGELFPVISYDMQSDEALLEEAKAQAAGPEEEVSADQPDYESPTLYALTQRANVAPGRDESPFPVCVDVNGDGIVEIPSNQLMPGHRNLDENDQLYLTRYNQLKGRSLTLIYAAAINREAGYRVIFPERWIGNVSIVSRREDNEWRFVAFDQSLDQSKELARIRVVSQKDYQDKFLSDYQVFGERGMFIYYGYVPPVDPESLEVRSPLAIELGELKSLFALL